MSHKTIHISPELHKKQKLEAIKLGVSLRDLIEKKLERP
ncbi:MAG: toxin-antitoxin system HicB family antitoxin, partial [Patescibacteria group bacterium]|nr:toxin-antitoxin system HicB family antitoxin [Patescibacteria group bacterium]